jgi:hypothetical protein
MSGWMKYPHLECADCEYNDDLRIKCDEYFEEIIVNHPGEVCKHDDCPHKEEEEEC